MLIRICSLGDGWVLRITYLFQMAKLNVEMQRRIVTNMYNVLMTASRLRETS